MLREGLLKSKPIPWTRVFFNEECPCGSSVKSYACCWRGNGQWEKAPVPAMKSKDSSANDRCYLSPLGGCSQKITREHFVSRNILERLAKKTLKFEGVGHFFGGKDVVEIGIDAFSAKVLCDNHNPALSGLDDAAGRAFTTIETLCEDFKNANLRKKSSFYLASGLDIERWLLKVYCGLVAAGKIRGLSGRALQRDELDISLLYALAGRRHLTPPLGFYRHTFVGQTLKQTNLSFGTIKLTDGSNEVGGLLLSLGIMALVLVTSPKYGHSFQDQNWHRHQTISWNVKQGDKRFCYLFTY